MTKPVPERRPRDTNLFLLVSLSTANVQELIGNALGESLKPVQSGNGPRSDPAVMVDGISLQG
jgi:hypothetical protein